MNTAKIKKIGTKKIIFLIFGILIIFCIIQHYSNISLFIGSGNWTLKNHKYKSTYNETQILYIINYQKPIMKFKEVTFTPNKEVSVTVPQNSKFIISLSANKTVLKNWSTDVNLNQTAIKPSKNIFITPILNFTTGKKGDSSRRQNLYFEPLKKGDYELKLNYSALENSVSETDYFILLNIKVE